MRVYKVLSKICQFLSVGDNIGGLIKRSIIIDQCSKSLNCLYYFINQIWVLIMSNSTAQFVSPNFAEFLLENANNGNEILAVLDDIVEGADTAL